VPLLLLVELPEPLVVPEGVGTPPLELLDDAGFVPTELVELELGAEEPELDEVGTTATAPPPEEVDDELPGETAVPDDEAPDVDDVGCVDDPEDEAAAVTAPDPVSLLAVDELPSAPPPPPHAANRTNENPAAMSRSEAVIIPWLAARCSV
jgi:hypothetical protein